MSRTTRRTHSRRIDPVLRGIQKLDRYINRRVLVPLGKDLAAIDEDAVVTTAATIYVLAIGAFVALGLLSILYWWFLPMVAPPAPNPLSVPQVQQTPVEQVRSDPWANQNWMRPEAARELRNKPGVINLALIESGAAWYSFDQTIAFTGEPIWRRARPNGLSALTVTGSSVTMVYNGQTYTLNTFQPFVHTAAKNYVYLIDTQSQVWQAEAGMVKTVSVSSVNPPVGIAPNSGLSFTTTAR